MRKLVTLFCLILFVNLKIYSQEKDTTDIIVDYFEQMPIFPGGSDSIWCFLEANFRYDILNINNEAVKYFIKFVIDSTGAAKEFNIIASRPQIVKNNHIDSLKRSEIIRVFRLMPKWEPATQHGRKISCWYTIQIKTPYTDFKCNKFKSKGVIENQPDSLAKFKIGNGTTNQERINDFLYINLVWPSEGECMGMVIIKFIVEKSGRLSNFKVVHQLCPDFDAEALRVLKIMPNWSPAIKDNKPVRSVVIIPILFGLK
jgi:bla regulator protein blaR1